MEKEKFYVTTPIYYPSADLHIGHAYCSVAADTLSRYKRMRNYDVYFLTGTDEHGQKIERKAKAKGVSPQEFVDEVVSGIKDLWNLFKITNDGFIRTTDKHHEETVAYIFQKLYDQGDIYEGDYEGLYCTPCESFWTKAQLKDGRCPDCGGKVEVTKEKCYFFRLSAYQERLEKLFAEDADFLQPQSSVNEMVNNFLKPGLEDLAVTRSSFTWGVKVPFNPKHVVYVWIDALSNYISALGYPEETEMFKRYWPADLHIVGKEITRFHTIIWPALLMALKLPLPKHVYAHGWLLFDGDKMSKSKGNVVDPKILVARYGLDAIRYFLMRDFPFGSDGSFSTEALIKRINSDLANDLGNLVSRVAAMIVKSFPQGIDVEIAYQDVDLELEQKADALMRKAQDEFDRYQFSVALEAIWDLINYCNKYIDATEPWVLAKDPDSRARLATVLYNLADNIRRIAIAIEPVMVETPTKIREIFGMKNPEDGYSNFSDALKSRLFDRQSQVQKGKALFPRIDLDKELEEVARLYN